MDEIVLQVLQVSQQFAQKQRHMWVMTNNEAHIHIALFHYNQTRKIKIVALHRL
jgi:hypothetical protein